MAFFIEKIIMHNRAPFDHLELNFSDKEIIILNAFNGGGKTTLLSHIVDSFYEIARSCYQREFEQRQNDFYRISSSAYNLDQQKFSIFYVRYNLDGENLDYIDIHNNITLQEYDETIKLEGKIPFESFSRVLERENCVKFISQNANEENKKKIFERNIATYFPSYRFEYPGYLNTPYKNDITFRMEGEFSGYLPNPIEVITDLPQLANWLMDVVLDWQIYKQSQSVLDENNKINYIDVTPENIRIFNILNTIIDKTLKKEDQTGYLRLGIGKRSNPGQRISVMCNMPDNTSKMYYPSIFNVSAGESAIITLFGEILHQADRVSQYNTVSGIVIVDEVDKHLHIKLQKEILPGLVSLFPNVQFIMSSHSPFITMGLSEKLSSRLKVIYLSNGGGHEIQAAQNPLYEEVYQMMLNDNENYKNLYERLKLTNRKYILLVEDSYVQIYKIAWLKLKGIDFDTDNLDSVFDKNAEFKIIGGNDCNGIAGLLNAKNTEIFSGKYIIGLFDYDKDGSERFYNLKEKFAQKKILGDLSAGFYKIKETVAGTKMCALMLPVPERLHPLISRYQNGNDKIWEGDGKFANYVEIETLLPTSYLKNNSSYESNNICGIKYYKARDKKKGSLWKDLVSQPKDIFDDFAPLFKAIYNLFELSEF